MPARPCEADVEAYDTVDAISHEWSALVERVGAPPWTRPGWVRAWMKARGTGSLEVLAVRGSAGLAGVALMQRGGAHSTTPPVWQCIVAETDDARASLAQALFARGRALVALQFGYPGTSGLDECLAASAGSGYLAVTVPYLRSPYVEVSGSWEAYLACRSRRLVKQIARQRRNLGAQGELLVEIVDGREHLNALLEEGFVLEASGWKGRRNTAIMSRSENFRYYEGLAEWAARDGLLRLAFLRLGGQAIAFDFLIEDQRRLYALKGGYAEPYAKFGPGVLLVHDEIAYCFEHSLKSLELLGDAEPWKLAWTEHVHERSTMLAFAPTLSGRLERLTRLYGPAVKRARALLAG